MESREEEKSRRQEIAKKINLILSGKNDSALRFYTKKGETKADFISADEFRAELTYELSHEPVIQLSRLYASLDNEGRNDMVSMCGFGMRRDQWLCNYSPQLFVFLARSFRFDKALDTLLANLTADEHGHYDLIALSDFLAHDHWRLSTEDLEQATQKLLTRWKELQNDSYERALVLPRGGGSLMGPPNMTVVHYSRASHAVHNIVSKVQGILVLERSTHSRNGNTAK